MSLGRLSSLASFKKLSGLNGFAGLFWIREILPKFLERWIKSIDFPANSASTKDEVCVRSWVVVI